MGVQVLSTSLIMEEVAFIWGQYQCISWREILLALLLVCLLYLDQVPNNWAHAEKELESDLFA